jgi:hypothetical protein
MTEPKRGNKFGAIPDVRDDLQFDSRLEARRYDELFMRERAGLIRDLVAQKADLTYRLEVNGVHICDYEADFRYFCTERERLVVEDVKSRPTRTAAYRMKRKLMLAIFGVVIDEVESATGR